jgi:hypothetical protein|tara:strand:- start:715 stop:1629 length:915 start_codon:yes stop_codon:yes gene_type:complete
MGYKNATETTQAYLENTPLPVHGKSYTVISHKNVIDNTKKLLEDSGFTISKEIYRANMNAQVAQGIYHIYPTKSIDDLVNNESELGMMFAWTNSYDKSARFQCAIGAHVFVCGNGMMAGDMMNFKRKHTGSASHDIVMELNNQIKNGEKHYKRMISDRDSLRNISLTTRQQSELLGRLFVDEDILTSTQAICVKKEINKSSYDYNCNDDNAWTFYNHITHSLKKSTPRDWMQDTQNFHDFMMTEVVNTPLPSLLENIDISNFDTTIDENFDINDIKDIINENNGTIEIDEDITPLQLTYDTRLS